MLAKSHSGRIVTRLLSQGATNFIPKGSLSTFSNYGAVPSRLQLTVERNGKSGTFLATRLDSGVDEESWDWHVLGDGSVEVGPGGRGWITDGWVIHLSRSGPEFRGKAWYWTDTGGGGRTFGVVVRKIACIQPRKHPRFGQ